MLRIRTLPLLRITQLERLIFLSIRVDLVGIEAIITCHTPYSGSGDIS
jgi:hypothetical protein